MEQDAFENYLSSRYERQLHWYEGKAASNKLIYHILQWSVIALSACLPVLVTYGGSASGSSGSGGGSPAVWLLRTTIAVSVLMAILTAAVKVFNFQENWINYRATVQKLLREKIYFETGVGVYGRAEDSRAVFIERVESVLTGESELWAEAQRPLPGN